MRRHASWPPKAEQKDRPAWPSRGERRKEKRNETKNGEGDDRGFAHLLKKQRVI